MLTDFHIHSTYSDGKLSIPELVDLFGSQGFGAIAITDHLCERGTFLGQAARILDRTLTPQTFSTYMEEIQIQADRAWAEYRMLVIPGFELTKNYLEHKRSMHVVALGVSNWIPAELSIPEMVEQVHLQGGLAIAAHPLSSPHRNAEPYDTWSRRYEWESIFDAWEITNTGRILDEVVRSSFRKIATSDLHARRQMSSWRTVIHSEKSRDAIFEAIRNQNLSFRFHHDLSAERERAVRSAGALLAPLGT